MLKFFERDGTKHRTQGAKHRTQGAKHCTRGALASRALANGVVCQRPRGEGASGTMGVVCQRPRGEGTSGTVG